MCVCVGVFDGSGPSWLRAFVCKRHTCEQTNKQHTFERTHILYMLGHDGIPQPARQPAVSLFPNADVHGGVSVCCSRFGACVVCQTIKLRPGGPTALEPKACARVRSTHTHTPHGYLICWHERAMVLERECESAQRRPWWSAAAGCIAQKPPTDRRVGILATLSRRPTAVSL